MKKSHSILATLTVAAGLWAAVSSAQAQGEIPTNNSRFFGVSAGQSDYSLGNGIGVFGSTQGDTAYNIHTGGYFSNNFGVEFGLTDFGKVKRAGGETKAVGINASIFGNAPMGNGFSLLGKVGTTYGSTSVTSAPASGITAGDKQGFGLSYGVGAQYSINSTWSTLLQYDSHNMGFAGDRTERIGVTTLGLRANF